MKTEKELIPLGECVKRAQAFLQAPEPPWKERTLRNKICAGEFTRYGGYRKPMVDWFEVKRSLARPWRRKARQS